MTVRGKGKELNEWMGSKSTDLYRRQVSISTQAI